MQANFAEAVALEQEDFDLRVEVVEGRDRFLALAPEWQALTRRASGYQYSQTFEWALASSETSPLGRGAEIKCVVARVGDRLVGVWAFFLTRNSLASTAHQMGCGSNEEYGGPMVETAGREDEITKALLARAMMLADILISFGFVAGTETSRLMESAGAFRTRFDSDGVFTDLMQFATWDDYMASLSTSFRSTLRLKMRRLQRTGFVSFELAETEAERVETLDWVLAEKAKWLDVRGKSHWIGSDATRAFWLAAANNPGEGGDILLFAVKLDGRPIAGCICLADPTRLVFNTTAFDPDFSYYSPGMLLLEGCLKASFERGVDFNFGLTVYDYKESWATGRVTYHSHSIACTPRGNVVLRAMHMKTGARHLAWRAARLMPAGWKQRAKDLLKGRRSSPAAA
jgi:CelD/BcsL family acetyltransferase involved in cellulose biosynthesis